MKTIKKTIFTLVTLALLGLSTAFAQVGIGTTNPHPSSILDVDVTSLPATEKLGFLPPRMSTAERDAINGGSPAEGLIIFNTDVDVNCLQWYNGTEWFNPCEGGSSATPCTTPTTLDCDPAATINAGDAITSNVSGGAGGTITWAITPTTGVSQATGTGSTTGAITFSTAGAYTVTFTSTNNSNPAGCSPAASVTCTRTITVDPAPCTSPTALTCDPAATINEGDAITSNVSGGAGGNITWAISPTTGVSQATGTGSTTGAITFGTAGAYTVTFTSTNNSNPSGCTPAASVACTRTITVDPAPTAVFCDGSPTPVVEIESVLTGRIWMDRNLGAAGLATNKFDTANGIGDFYQWGRFTDGHQCLGAPTHNIDDAGLTRATTAEPFTGADWDGKFITSMIQPDPKDWLATRNDNLWQGVDGVNNPCPSGFRLPTTAEYHAELDLLASTPTGGLLGGATLTGMFNLLKMISSDTGHGERKISDGTLSGNFNTVHWTSTVSTINPGQSNRFQMFFNETISNDSPSVRQLGMQVRCIKHVP